MEMKQYLIDTFKYNDYANKLALAKIFEMRNAERGVRNENSKTDECIRFFSHLINSMNKWLARIEQTSHHPVGETPPPLLGQEGSYLTMDWWLSVYQLDELEAKWDECLAEWLDFLESKTEDQLFEEVEWFNPDIAPVIENHPAAEAAPLLRKEGNFRNNFAAKITDIALQLNYHSIHHRAQIQYLIRQQGIEPDFVDYIGTKYRRL